MSAISLSPTRRNSTAASTFVETNDSVVVHVVDDDAGLCSAPKDLFATVGLATRTCRTASDFLNSGFTDSPGCMVVDLRLPDMNGLALHAKLAETCHRLPVVMMTGYADIPMAVGAMKGVQSTFFSSHFVIRR